MRVFDQVRFLCAGVFPELAAAGINLKYLQAARNPCRRQLPDKLIVGLGLVDERTNPAREAVPTESATIPREPSIEPPMPLDGLWITDNARITRTPSAGARLEPDPDSRPELIAPGGAGSTFSKTCIRRSPIGTGDGLGRVGAAQSVRFKECRWSVVRVRTRWRPSAGRKRCGRRRCRAGRSDRAAVR